METEAQGSDDFRDDSLGILEIRRIISHLKWVKTNSLKQSHSTAAPLTFGTGSFFAGGVGRSCVYRMLSSIPGLHPPDSNRTHPPNHDNQNLSSIVVLCLLGAELPPARTPLCSIKSGSCPWPTIASVGLWCKLSSS